MFKFICVLIFASNFLVINLVSAESVTVYTKVNGNGALLPESAELQAGDKHSVYVTPVPGFSLKKISGCNGSYEYGVYIINTVTTNCMVTAEFIEGGNGVDIFTGDNSSSIEKGSAGANSIISGADAVKINSASSTNPAAGSGASKGSGKLLLLLIASDVAANFVDVTASVIGVGGSVTPTSQKVRKGTSASLTISPANGFKLASAQGCGLVSSQSGSVLTPAITTACNISVMFEKLATAVWDSFAWDEAVWG